MLRTFLFICCLTAVTLGQQQRRVSYPDEIAEELLTPTYAPPRHQSPPVPRLPPLPPPPPQPQPPPPPPTHHQVLPPPPPPPQPPPQIYVDQQQHQESFAPAPPPAQQQFHEQPFPVPAPRPRIPLQGPPPPPPLVVLGGNSLQQGNIFEPMMAGEMAQLVGVDVACSMTNMRITISFDRPFGGVIYAKGFFNNRECQYVPWGGNQATYEFDVNLDHCGTQWYDNMASGGTAVLENVLLIQYEPGVQEMWDVARRVQCTWSGRQEQTVTQGVDVDMLDTATMTYSGDDFSADMDIQLGRGPFAPRAEGLMHVGDILTLVVHVYGSGDMDVVVKDCVAHDGDRQHSLQLTDNRGCIINKKLMGAWQFTKDTGATGANLIAFSFLQAFRFPDKPDMSLECSLEMCKGPCQNHCPDYPAIDLRSIPRERRGRRSVNEDAESLVAEEEAERYVMTKQNATLKRIFRVIQDSDVAWISAEANALATAAAHRAASEICVPMAGFAIGLAGLAVLLLLSFLAVGVIYSRMMYNKRHHKEINMVPNLPPCKKWSQS